MSTVNNAGSIRRRRVRILRAPQSHDLSASATLTSTRLMPGSLASCPRPSRAGAGRRARLYGKKSERRFSSPARRHSPSRLDRREPIRKSHRPWWDGGRILCRPVALLWADRKRAPTLEQSLRAAGGPTWPNPLKQLAFRSRVNEPSGIASQGSRYAFRSFRTRDSVRRSSEVATHCRPFGKYRARSVGGGVQTRTAGLHVLQNRGQ